MAKELFQVFRTAENTQERLFELPPSAYLNTGSASRHSVYVNPTKTFQTFLGFGCALTEASAMTYAEMAAAQKEEVVKACFDPTAGLGYQIARLHINACDFSRGKWACDETPGDTNLRDFSLKYDQEYILPLVKHVQRHADKDLLFFASPWSPPAWMKTTGEMIRGGKLKPECRDAWAEYYCRFIKEYGKEGIRMWGLSVQNEPAATQPWESCVYTAEEERDFVRDHLGPALERNGLQDIKVMIWDHNRDLLLQRASLVYQDPAAARYVWGACFHWYCENCFDHPRLLHEAFPDKHLLFSEGCQEGGPHIGSWALGERYARSIISDLNAWTEAWVDWNMLLNEQGGPNHVGNFCSAPILFDRQNKKLLYQSSYYYIAHLSRFIRPGAKRLSCSSTHDALEVTAFLNPDGRIAVVALNRSAESIVFSTSLKGQTLRLESPAHSIVSVLG